MVKDYKIMTKYYTDKCILWSCEETNVQSKTNDDARDSQVIYFSQNLQDETW